MFRFPLILTICSTAAVVLPVLGGMLWRIDYRIVFFAGAILGSCSLIATQFLRIPETAPATAMAAPPTPVPVRAGAPGGGK